MKITKTKLAAASFGAALTSLYAAPDLCADDGVDTNPDVGIVSFAFDGVVPRNTEPMAGYYTAGVQAGAMGLGTYGPNIVFTFFNNDQYGFGVAVPGASSLVSGTALMPGAAFCGGLDGDGNPIPGLIRELPGPTLPALLSVEGTGVQTVGFLIGGGIGYFRVDLGDGTGDVMVLDAQIALSAADGTNDFTITIPPLPDGGPEILLGDVNTDGVVDFLDISPFIVVLSGGGFQDEADIDQNGVVDFLDISPFIQILSGASSLQVSWSDSTGKALERFAAGNELIEQQIQAVEVKLQQEFNTAVAQANRSAVDSGSASLGLAALAMGAAGLRRRRKAATAA